MGERNDETQWLSSDERAAWLAVTALTMKLPNALDTQLQADQGLSFFEYMVLAVLSEQQDRTLQMSVIATATSASLSRLSHTVKRLEQEGFVRRGRLPGAGRRTSATLTDAGYRKVAEAAPGHVARVRELVIDAISPAQLKVLRKIGIQVMARIDPDHPGNSGEIAWV
ncbi:MAG TPA: MarR family transcriptional regulator [Microlunatus sp.]